MVNHIRIYLLTLQGVHDGAEAIEIPHVATQLHGDLYPEGEHARPLRQLGANQGDDGHKVTEAATPVHRECRLFMLFTELILWDDF